MSNTTEMMRLFPTLGLATASDILGVPGTTPLDQPVGSRRMQPRGLESCMLEEITLAVNVTYLVIKILSILFHPVFLEIVQPGSMKNKVPLLPLVTKHSYT